MRDEELHRRRARYVKTLLTWHEVPRETLADWLGVALETVYKKLDVRRAFTTEDLIEIAERFQLDPRLLLWPPEGVDELGARPMPDEIVLTAPRRRSSGRSPSAGSGSFPRKSGCSANPDISGDLAAAA